MQFGWSITHDMFTLELLYFDGSLVAINKPPGLLVHRSNIAADVKEFAVQLLRDQLGQHVFPVHRIDRKTSGVLLFALDQETNQAMNLQFDKGEVGKKYRAIVRGYTPDQETIDYPLRKENGTPQEAITHYRTLARTEVPVELGKHSTQRYSLVEIETETGRRHQIRKHFAHVFHPIIGDRPHGCNKQNKLFKEKWDMEQMMLHALSITFRHPVQGSLVSVSAPYPPEFTRVLALLGLGNASTYINPSF